MRLVLQKVKSAKCLDNDIEIGEGCVLFLGISKDDTLDIIDWMTDKILKLRLYDEWKKTIGQKNYEILIKLEQSVLKDVSTRHASPEVHYLEFYEGLRSKYMPSRVKLVNFGTNPHMEIVNDGPFTACLEK